MKKLVSIVIPVYNSELYIKECIDSFICQTYTNIELILIDDGSTDRSLEILREYQQENPALIFVYSQKNAGVAVTRNRGISYSHGEYLMFADNDDYVEKDYVERMVSELATNNSDMVVGSCRKVDDSHNVLYEQKLTDEVWSKFRVIAPWARIMRRDFVVEKGIEFGDFRLGEDSYFTVTAYNESPNIHVTSYIGYNWVQRKTSVSNTIQKKGIASPIPFLDSLIQRNKPLKFIKNEYFEYFIIKFLVWNLCYICDDVDYEVLEKDCNQYFLWLEKKYPKYKKNQLVSPFLPKGEEWKIRILVWIFAKTNMKTRVFLLKVVSKIKKYISMK